MDIPSESFPNFKASRRPVHVFLPSYRYARPKELKLGLHEIQSASMLFGFSKFLPPERLPFPFKLGCLVQ